MSKLLIACALALALGGPSARAADKEPAKNALEAVLAALDTETVRRDEQKINDTSLFELVQDLSKRHSIPIVILNHEFEKVDRPNVADIRPNVITTSLRGLTERQVLNVVLDSVDATYIVRNDRVEIVPTSYAAKLTKSELAADGKLAQPLVSTVVKEKPLNETVAKLAETYELNVFVSPQAGDARTAFVSARLMNVPADKALELLALQADLRVVKKGNAFVLTSKEHAEGLFNEKQDRERQKIELEKLRETPVAPKPPAPPEPKM